MSVDESLNYLSGGRLYESKYQGQKIDLIEMVTNPNIYGRVNGILVKDVGYVQRQYHLYTDEDFEELDVYLKENGLSEKYPDDILSIRKSMWLFGMAKKTVEGDVVHATEIINDTTIKGFSKEMMVLKYLKTVGMHNVSKGILKDLESIEDSGLKNHIVLESLKVVSDNPTGHWLLSNYVRETREKYSNYADFVQDNLDFLKQVNNDPKLAGHLQNFIADEGCFLPEGLPGLKTRDENLAFNVLMHDPINMENISRMIANKEEFQLPQQTELDYLVKVRDKNLLRFYPLKKLESMYEHDDPVYLHLKDSIHYNIFLRETLSVDYDQVDPHQASDFILSELPSVGVLSFKKYTTPIDKEAGKGFAGSTSYRTQEYADKLAELRGVNVNYGVKEIEVHHKAMVLAGMYANKSSEDSVADVLGRCKHPLDEEMKDHIVFRSITLGDYGELCEALDLDVRQSNVLDNILDKGGRRRIGLLNRYQSPKVNKEGLSSYISNYVARLDDEKLNEKLKEPNFATLCAKACVEMDGLGKEFFQKEVNLNEEARLNFIKGFCNLSKMKHVSSQWQSSDIDFEKPVEWKNGVMHGNGLYEAGYNPKTLMRMVRNNSGLNEQEFTETLSKAVESGQIVPDVEKLSYGNDIDMVKTVISELPFSSDVSRFMPVVSDYIKKGVVESPNGAILTLIKNNQLDEGMDYLRDNNPSLYADFVFCGLKKHGLHRDSVFSDYLAKDKEMLLPYMMKKIENGEIDKNVVVKVSPDKNDYLTKVFKEDIKDWAYNKLVYGAKILNSALREFSDVFNEALLNRRPDDPEARKVLLLRHVDLCSGRNSEPYLKTIRDSVRMNVWDDFDVIYQDKEVRDLVTETVDRKYAEARDERLKDALYVLQSQKAHRNETRSDASSPMKP